MGNKSFIATVLFAVLVFPQIFGCAGTEFGRALEANMGYDGYQVVRPIGPRSKGVSLARMALSRDGAVILPALHYMRLGPNPQEMNIVFEHSRQGIDYAVVRCKLADGTTVSSLVIVPQQGSETRVFTLLKDNGNEYSIYPAGKDFVVLAQATKEDPQMASLTVLNGTTTNGDATMSYKDISQGIVFDPVKKSIWTLKELADKSKQSKPKVAKIETDSMPAAQSIPLTRKDEPASATKDSSTPAAKSSPAAQQPAPEPAPSGPKVLQDSKQDTQSIL